MTSNKHAKTDGDQRRVSFDIFNSVYHEAPIALSREDSQASWYSAKELKENLQEDIRDTIREYIKRVKEGTQPDDKNYLGSVQDANGSTYGRGLDFLCSEEKERKKRCELYRSLVLRQYEALQTSMAGNHASEMLHTFATEKSRWARTRASAVAAEDAAQARQVYREAFQSKEGADQGLGILPARRFRGDVKRRSDRARSA